MLTVNGGGWFLWSNRISQPLYLFYYKQYIDIVVRDQLPEILQTFSCLCWKVFAEDTPAFKIFSLPCYRVNVFPIPLLTQELEESTDDACLTLHLVPSSDVLPMKPFLTLCLQWWAWIFPLPCPSLSVNYGMELNQKIWYSLAISTKGFQSSVKTEMQEPQQLEK